MAGGLISWMWRGKKDSGRIIRKTKDKLFARTHNGKVKTILRKKRG